MFLSYEVLVIGLILSADSFSATVAMGIPAVFREGCLLKFAFASGAVEGLVALSGEKIVG